MLKVNPPFAEANLLQSLKDADQHWHQCLGLMSKIMLMEELEMSGEEVRTLPKHGPVGIYAKIWLTEYFKDKGGYYGSNNPHSLKTIFNQKIEGVKAFLRRDFSVNQEVYVDRIKSELARLSKYKGLYLDLDKQLAGQKFFADKHRSAAGRIFDAINNMSATSVARYLKGCMI